MHTLKAWTLLLVAQMSLIPCLYDARAVDSGPTRKVKPGSYHRNIPVDPSQQTDYLFVFEAEGSHKLIPSRQSCKFSNRTVGMIRQRAFPTKYSVYLQYKSGATGVFHADFEGYFETQGGGRRGRRTPPKWNADTEDQRFHVNPDYDFVRFNRLSRGDDNAISRTGVTEAHYLAISSFDNNNRITWATSAADRGEILFTPRNAKGSDVSVKFRPPSPQAEPFGKTYTITATHPNPDVQSSSKLHVVDVDLVYDGLKEDKEYVHNGNNVPTGGEYLVGDAPKKLELSLSPGDMPNGLIRLACPYSEAKFFKDAAGAIPYTGPFSWRSRTQMPSSLYVAFSRSGSYTITLSYRAPDSTTFEDMVHVLVGELRVGVESDYVAIGGRTAKIKGRVSATWQRLSVPDLRGSLTVKLKRGAQTITLRDIQPASPTTGGAEAHWEATVDPARIPSGLYQIIAEWTVTRCQDPKYQFLVGKTAQDSSKSLRVSKFTLVAKEIDDNGEPVLNSASDPGYQPADLAIQVGHRVKLSLSSADPSFNSREVTFRVTGAGATPNTGSFGSEGTATISFPSAGTYAIHAGQSNGNTHCINVEVGASSFYVRAFDVNNPSRNSRTRLEMVIKAGSRRTAKIQALSGNSTPFNGGPYWTGIGLQRPSDGDLFVNWRSDAFNPLQSEKVYLISSRVDSLGTKRVNLVTFAYKEIGASLSDNQGARRYPILRKLRNFNAGFLRLQRRLGFSSGKNGFRLTGPTLSGGYKTYPVDVKGKPVVSYTHEFYDIGIAGGIESDDVMVPGLGYDAQIVELGLFLNLGVRTSLKGGVKWDATEYPVKTIGTLKWAAEGTISAALKAEAGTGQIWFIESGVNIGAEVRATMAVNMVVPATITASKLTLSPSIELSTKFSGKVWVKVGVFEESADVSYEPEALQRKIEFGPYVWNRGE